MSIVRFAFFAATSFVVSAVGLGIGGCTESDSTRPSSRAVTSGSSGDDHSMEEHVDAGHEDHFVRDPATMPCDEANWRGFIPDLRECILPGKNLDDEILRRVDFTDADLTASSFIGADLFKSVFVRAKLGDANFTKAHMVSVDLSQANLSGAKFEGADLTNAILTDAIVVGATTDETTVCPNLQFGPCW